MGLVHGDWLRIFVSELKTFVKLHFCDDIRSDDWLRKDVFEIGSQLHWIDSLNVTAGHFSQSAKHVEIAFITDDWDDVDGDSVFLSKET